MRFGGRGKHADVVAPRVVALNPEEIADGDLALAEVLIAETSLRQSDLDVVLASLNGARLADAVVQRGLISDAELARALGKYYGVDFNDFRESIPSPEATALLTAQDSRELAALPISVSDDEVVLAVIDPSPGNLARIQEMLQRPFTPVVTTARALHVAYDNAYRATSGVAQHVELFEARDQLRRAAQGLEAAGASEEAPVVRVVQMIITQALRDRASDIHVEPHGDRVRIRYRIDGALTEVLSLPGSIGPAIVSRLKVLASMNIVERRRPQDGQIAMEVEGRKVDIRVATTAVVGGEKVVMRLLDKSRPLFKLADLGMPADLAARYSDLLHIPYGMVICAGPTGGGKTTTLYASLGQLNTPDRNIMTIEDPVEYTFDSINQIQINEQAGITFSGGLKSILRQDPDVILVGEVRDVETARIAVQSALTGHAVLSSLHATDAVSALYRLLDMGIEPFLIASAVTAVVSQRLVRRSCTYCLDSYAASPEELSFLEMFGGREPVDGFRKGMGCNFCSHTGYLERIGVYELLVISDSVREMIVDRRSHEDVRKLARAQGMRSLQEQAALLVSEGVTTASEVMRSIYVAGA